MLKLCKELEKVEISGIQTFIISFVVSIETYGGSTINATMTYPTISVAFIEENML